MTPTQDHAVEPLTQFQPKSNPLISSPDEDPIPAERLGVPRGAVILVMKLRDGYERATGRLNVVDDGDDLFDAGSSDQLSRGWSWHDALPISISELRWIVFGRPALFT